MDRYTDCPNELEVHLETRTPDWASAISGSPRFLTDTSISPDATLQFENWRRIYYELMVPDVMQDRVLDAGGEEGARPTLSSSMLTRLHVLNRHLGIDLVNDNLIISDAHEEADYGALAPLSFLGDSHEGEGTAYVLGGRNWRKPPKNRTWKEEHPANTIYIVPCDVLLKWRKDTEDAQKATDDFSGSLTEATGFIDIEEKFGGFFMPFSGYDADPSIRNIKWVADISKDDDVCKYTPELTIETSRAPLLSPDELIVLVTTEDPRFPAMSEPIVFTRPPYPLLELEDKTIRLASGATDDGKVRVKEPALNKELVLSFDAGKTEVTSAQSGQLEDLFISMVE